MKKNIQIIQEIRRSVFESLMKTRAKKTAKKVAFDIFLEEFDHHDYVQEKLEYLEILKKRKLISDFEIYTKKVAGLDLQIKKPSSIEIEKNPDALFEYLNSEGTSLPPITAWFAKGHFYPVKLRGEKNNNEKLVKDLILIENKIGIIKWIIINHDYKNPIKIKKFSGRSPWSILRLIYGNGGVNLAEGMRTYTYINSNKNCPLYKNTGYNFSPILGKDGKEIIAKIPIKIQSERVLKRAK